MENKLQLTDLIISGPVQSSHYEDSSDDDCDDGHAQGPRSSSEFRRQCSNIGNSYILMLLKTKTYSCMSLYNRRSLTNFNFFS